MKKRSGGKARADGARPSRSSSPAGEGALTGGPERLQKLLARAGYGSRRKCEELITNGGVTVDGKVVTELGSKADPAEQDVRVEGRRLRVETPVYYLLNKPKGVLCTVRDPQGRRTVLDLIPERRRIFPVGRLDAESRGAVILTNDGSFTNLLTHPRYGVEKTYLVRVRGEVDDNAVEKLRHGIWLAEGRTLPARVWVMKRRSGETELGLGISEGKNRQVRRMLAKLDYKVLALTRTRIGPLTLRGLGDGAHRELTKDEVLSLKKLARKNAQEPQTQPRARRTRARARGKPDPAQAGPAQAGRAPRGE
ncbi:MAG: rRNA pseudouridine synthase [Planctomycetes bacterium]|nr:rRNA pseudouridine synthase [Planctomycetota bacterium]